MSYTTNPHMPHIRMRAARLVIQDKWSTRKVARYTGFNQSSIVRWVRRARNTNRHILPTRSSRPRHHPSSLRRDIVCRILELRQERNQCAEILHFRLIQEGVIVSLSSVKRILKHYGMTRYSKWKKWHSYPLRPVPRKPGILVQIDTIHIGACRPGRLYVYTMLDVCSRWTYASPIIRISTHASLRFIRNAEQELPFSLQMLQSDHGPEFSKWFTTQCTARGISHRHSRVRRPTDNGHLERFNRTIQDECLRRIPQTLDAYLREIPEYLRYYNTERPHMGLDMKTPLEVMQSY